MARASDGGKTRVGWWTALLLIALACVLIGLYVAARLLLSLELDVALAEVWGDARDALGIGASSGSQ